MGLFGRRRARAAVAALAEHLVLDRAWDDIALDVGVDAVRDGHRRAGVALLRECREDHEVRAQRVRALADAAVGQSVEIRDLLGDGLSQAEAADLLLWLGSTLIAEAWRIRGAGWRRSVDDERHRLFRSRLREARDPLMAAAKLAPNDATPWVELQRYARGLRLDRTQHDLAWIEATDRCPTSYPAHAARLQSLTGKWGGSHEAMFAFARETVAKCEPGSPLVAMLPTAHAEYLLVEGDRHIAEGNAWAYVKLNTRHFTPTVREELVAADEKWRSPEDASAGDLEAHNLLGWAMLEIGDHDRARAHLSKVGNRPSYLPWSYNGEHAYARALVRLGLD
ncbi:hypothetical protein V5P93_006408 [Actinokineospora auranticolor]|uniref:DUF4034 domain-containing protein n=1 Tax=Actinokineospora auranticolor TaxID=155976 RepID=A0A2S6GFM1_9PSEU|nr:hypothetical protein [Actinokineospora auranticolor]PPK64027.1 hypothetical protein CLV40_12218 [Actinokineospora auranticolor]